MEKSILPKTIEEAKVVVAKEYIIMQERIKDVKDSEFDKRPIEAIAGKILFEYQDCLLKLYSLPWLRDKIKAWSIAVRIGKKYPCNKSDKDKENVIKLSKEIKAYLGEIGFNVEDASYFSNNWHILHRCTDSESNRFIDLLHTKFKNEIELDEMSVFICSFQPMLFNGYEETEKFIEENLKGKEKDEN